MRTFPGILLLLILLFSFRTAEIAAGQSGGPAEGNPTLVPEVNAANTVPGLPDVFHLDYLIESDSISPDGNYGVIVPKLPNLTTRNCRNYFVALRPTRVLGFCADAYFPHDRHGRTSLTVQWSADSAAALVIVTGTHGTVSAALFELRAGQVARCTDLYAEVVKLAEPDFRRSKAEPYEEGESFGAVEGGWDSGGDGLSAIWRVDRSRRVRIDCLFSNNPEPSEEDKKTWSGRVRAVWDIAQHKFTQQKYIHVSP